jgi:hypothetical protein
VRREIAEDELPGVQPPAGAKPADARAARTARRRLARVGQGHRPGDCFDLDRRLDRTERGQVHGAAGAIHDLRERRWDAHSVDRHPAPAQTGPLQRLGKPASHLALGVRRTEGEAPHGDGATVEGPGSRLELIGAGDEPRGPVPGRDHDGP